MNNCLRHGILNFALKLSIQVIAVLTYRGKSMLTQTEMFVVFMLDEIISQGNLTRLTAGDIPKSTDRGFYP